MLKLQLCLCKGQGWNIEVLRVFPGRLSWELDPENWWEDKPVFSCWDGLFFPKRGGILVNFIFFFKHIWFRVIQSKRSAPGTPNNQFFIKSLGWFKMFTWEMVTSIKKTCCLEFRVKNQPQLMVPKRDMSTKIRPSLYPNVVGIVSQFTSTPQCYIRPFLKGF